MSNSESDEEDFFEDNSYTQVFQQLKDKKKKPPTNLIGNGKMHFLPFKIKYNGYAPVDSFFDSLIQNKDMAGISNSNNDLNNINKSSINYTTSFRGRILNGKKLNNNYNFSIRNLKIKKSDTNKVIVMNSIKIEDAYVWKFDEEIPYNNNLLNIECILNNMNVLK